MVREDRSFAVQGESRKIGVPRDVVDVALMASGVPGDPQPRYQAVAANRRHADACIDQPGQLAANAFEHELDTEIPVAPRLALEVRDPHLKNPLVEQPVEKPGQAAPEQHAFVEFVSAARSQSRFSTGC